MRGTKERTIEIIDFFQPIRTVSYFLIDLIGVHGPYGLEKNFRPNSLPIMGYSRRKKALRGPPAAFPHFGHLATAQPKIAVYALFWAMAGLLPASKPPRQDRDKNPKCDGRGDPTPVAFQGCPKCFDALHGKSIPQISKDG